MEEESKEVVDFVIEIKRQESIKNHEKFVQDDTVGPLLLKFCDIVNKMKVHLSFLFLCFCSCFKHVT